jgi:serine/threonine protein kinase
MKVFNGTKQINLGNKEYIARGGEGSVYGKGKEIYKIYHDPKHMIPEAKIAELSCLKSDNILYPKDVLKSNSGKLIGYTMVWKKDTDALCRLFSNGFRDAQGFTLDNTLGLVNNILSVIEFIHQQNCLMVDGNEHNYLVDNKTYKIPYFIDVDSYQTKSFPPTAIMPSIKDWNCNNNFSNLSDWYSFGIIACQLFVGIHPFKGTHPNYARGDLEDRMRDSISIFNKLTRVPAAARSFDNIPTSYKEWFLKIFESPDRMPPPDKMGIINIVKITKPTKLKSTDKLDIRMIFQFEDNENILYHNSKTTKTTDYIYIESNKFLPEQSVLETEILVTPKSDTPIFVNLHNSKLTCDATTVKVHIPNIEASDMMIVDNKLYLINDGNLIETSIDEMTNIIISVNQIWKISPNSSKIFSNVIYEDLLGKSFLTIPIPGDYSESELHSVRIPELDEYKIIDAKHQMLVATIIGYKNGEYDRFNIKFDERYSQYQITKTENIDDLTINFVVLPNGLVVEAYEGFVNIYNNQISSSKVKVIKDDRFDSSYRLCADGMKVCLFKDNRLYSLKTK